MKVALDYDSTYTLDPELWNKFIDMLQLRDHEVMVVTYRDEDLPIDHELPIPIYYTAFHAKRNFMEEKGIHIDVWIDDWPEGILLGKGNPYDIKT